jgi:hypothetical protein
MPPPTTSAAVDASAITASLSKVSMADISKVLFETSKELREANREMRHASRDAAVMEANTAADEIRSGGLKNMIFGLVAGGIGIASGAFSVYQGAGQIKSLTKMDTSANTVAGQFNQTKADVELGTAQSRLKSFDETGVLPEGATSRDDLVADVKSKAASAGALDDGAAAGIDRKIQSKQGSLDHLKSLPGDLSPPDSTKTMTTLRGEIGDLGMRKEMYTDPTSPEALAAGERFAGKHGDSVKKGGSLFEAHSLASGNAATLRTDIQIKGVKLQGINAVGSGGAQLIQGIGGFVSAGDQAESSEATARAETAKSAESEMADYQKSFDELLRSVMDIVRKFAESQTQANSAIIQNM